MQPNILSFVVLPLAMCGSLAGAQNVDLYEPPRDPDASYIRVFAPDARMVSVDGRPAELNATGASAYLRVQPGTQNVTIDGHETSIDVPTAAFFTVLKGAGRAPSVHLDQSLQSPTQAEVAFYNLSDLPVADLHVVEPAVLAIAEIGSMNSGEVSIRAPLTLDFAVAEPGGTPLAKVETVTLERSRAKSLYLFGSVGAYTLVAVSDAFQD